MSETLEERIRNRADADLKDAMVSAYAGDIVEILDERDAIINRLVIQNSICRVALRNLLETADDVIWLHDTSPKAKCQCKSCAKQQARQILGITEDSN